jgi:cation diffusion facilitator family transporter
MASSSSKKVIIAALAGNFLIALTKFIAYVLTGSSAMLSEGVHSVVDTGNQILLLYGLRRAKMPANERFPFGHGKEVYFWSFVVAIMIFCIISSIRPLSKIHTSTMWFWALP